MLMIISPSKKQNPYRQNDFFTEIEQHNEYKEVKNVIEKIKIEELKNILKISESIAKKSYIQNSNLSTKPEKSKANRAIDLYNGDLYTTLGAQTLNKNHLEYLQEHLRIVSALYGVVRPLDLIEPHRLDMGVGLIINNKSLRDYWKIHTHKAINGTLKNSNRPVVNLASKEYFDAIDLSMLNSEVINISFRDMISGKYKTVSIYAKRARGMMVRFAAINNIQDASDLMQFDMDGYKFNPSFSTKKEWVFTRGS